MKQSLHLICICLFLAAARAIGAEPATSEVPLAWHDIRQLPLEGKGWQDTTHYYDRLPSRAEKTVRTPVWKLSHDSAGMCVRFLTDAIDIQARWTLRREPIAMAHMPASGVSGLDLYTKENGKWHWVGSGRPDKFPSNDKALVKGLKPGFREYLLYLPLYNGVEEVQIGMPAAARFEPAPPRIAKTKSVAFYGTSILQGGCASRPGMAYPSILCRKLGVPHLNLGFSGNALSEPEVARLLAELDPSVYVLDPLPNMIDKNVSERTEPFIKTLRAAHPTTPIILVENIRYTDEAFVPVHQKRTANSNARLREIYEKLVKAGDKRLLYVSSEKLLGDDGEGTVDGTHPTDVGFMRMAEAIEPALKRALKLSVPR